MSQKVPAVGFEPPDPEDSQFQPMDAPDDLPEPIEETTEPAPEAEVPGEAQESDSPSPKAAASDELLDKLEDLISSRLEKGLTKLSKRLEQSNRDAVRARVAKLYADQAQFLNELRESGQITQAAYDKRLGQIGSQVEQKVDSEIAEIQKAPLTIEDESPTNSQTQFNDVALALFRKSGLQPSDPEAKELQKVRLTSNFAESVAIYTDELRRLEKAKLQRTRSGGSPTRSDVGKGKSVSVAALTEELQSLMKQAGGSIEERRAREKRMDEIDALLEKATKR